MSSQNLTSFFDKCLAEMLSEKISATYPLFNAKLYIDAVDSRCESLSLTKRVELHADELYKNLPKDFKTAIEILIPTLGEENRDETGMFSKYYWIMPIAKFVEKYGVEHFDESISAIEEITKRNTGEYAIRPFIRRYPEKTVEVMTDWARSDSFHLRRLASEGLRPKLPWATKLDTFIENPEPVFHILELLKEDRVAFVKRSVANHLTDWIKVNRVATTELINSWERSTNRDTQWIIKRATRGGDLLK